MSEPRERMTGWFGLVILGCALSLFPIWFLLTAVTIQLTPELSGLDQVLDGGEEVGQYPSLQVWWIGGLYAAQMMVVAAPGLLGVLGVGSAIAYWRAHRGRADRARLDALVRADAVVLAPSWSAAEEERDSEGPTV